MSVYIPDELYEQVKSYTDAGEWKHSWHWARDRSKPWAPLTLTGVRQMLRDLDCDGDMQFEIDAAVLKIRHRYALADKLREIIQREEIREIADSHDEGCTCETCVLAGYAKTEG